MLSKHDNELLTRVGPGTPMGNLFRQYWLPAFMSDELAEPDGAPLRLRLLSEDLVAWRNTDGSIGMMQNALGQPEFPGIDMNGGTFFGLPVVVSENIPRQVAVEGPPAIPAGERIILAKASEILLADDGGVTIDVSREASLQMDNAPTAGAQSLVSLWQNNMVALRAERFINWKRRRLQAVGYINSANYVA